MITTAEAEGLRAIRAAGPAVISLYLPVPVDLAEHRGLPVRARELVKAAAEPAGDGARLRDADLEPVVRVVSEHSHDWLGRTAAIFSCAGLGLLEVFPLPGHLAAQAVVTDRPYLRPLLAAIQRHPAYRAALVDSQHAWILAVSDDRIETLAERTDPGLRSPGFAGWYGLEGYRIQQRVMELSRQHVRDTITILERSAGGGRTPLVLGGHENEISRFRALLPPAVRQDVAGTFRADLQTATPGRVRELAGPVIAGWADRTERQVVADILDQPPGQSVTTDLDRCLAASRARAVAGLVLLDGQMVPGFACATCGVLAESREECDCQDPSAACRAVPDVLDALASRTLDDGGQVITVRDAPFAAAARLRFPVAAGARGSRPRVLP